MNSNDDSLEVFIEYVAQSTNSIYSGIHWAKRNKHKNDCYAAVRAAIVKQKQFLSAQVNVQPILGKGKRGYDVSNYSYTYKMIEDSLVKLGVFADDTSKIVKRVIFNAPIRGEKTGILLTISSI